MKNYTVTELTRETLNQVNAEIIADFKNDFINKPINIQANGFRPGPGEGTVTEIAGDTFRSLMMQITFADGSVKKYCPNMTAAFANTKPFANPEDTELLLQYHEAAAALLEAENEITRLEKQAELEAIAAEKKAKAEAEKAKKAEAAYEAKKQKAIADFADMSNKVRTVSVADNFYYTLGWLAKHMGSLTAILPDYLGGAFEKHFGIEAPKTLVDSRAKTSGGYAKQWSWEFKCGIKKLKEATVPTYLHTVTSDISKGIHNTSFLWDLVENYGFQFGKKQDVESIRSHVPTECLSAFEAGLA